MKIRQLMKMITEISEEEQLGKKLIAQGWKIKQSFMYPNIKATPPNGEPIVIDGQEADDIQSALKHGQDEKEWTLGYMKKNNLLESVLTEGVYDPGILKAIFLIGSPGSGKSYIMNQLLGVGNGTTFSRHGLKLVTPDPMFEKLLNAAKVDPKNLDNMHKNDLDQYTQTVEPIRLKAKKLTAATETNYIEGRLGIILEGTGKNVNSLLTLKNKLEKLGYDCIVMFVNTDLETSKKRNSSRSRTIPEDMLIKIWTDSQKNLGAIQSAFGSADTIIIDNSTDSDLNPKISKQIDRFIAKNVKNPIGLNWIKQQLQMKNRK